MYGRRKKGGKKKLRKVAGTEIKGCGWRGVCTPPIQSEMAKMSNPGIKVSRNGQFA